MGLLDGDLADSIYRGFKGKLLKGVLRRIEQPTSGALDAHGDRIDASPIDQACEGFTEAYDAAYRQRAGIPATDLKVCIFAASLKGLVPRQDFKVRLDRKRGSQWYQLRGAATDPAEALWVCQAFEIEAPQ